MDILGSIQELIYLAFGLVIMGLAIFGLVDALRHRPDAFTAAGKASKNLWLAVLAGAVALSVLSIGNPFNITGILAVVGAGVYLADVRPALRRVIGRGSSGDGPARRW
jgi:NhaP-type Na+/H+ or K+/H+ antiporter